MSERELIKVRLHDRNEDSESVWAFDLGPVKGKRGARRVQINNICFVHAKPTLHDIIVVEPDPEDGDYMLQWDQRGVPWSKIGTRIDEDGGRFAMIVDYRYGPDGDRWRDLVTAVTRPGLDIEGAFGPKGDRPGRAYLAVDKAIKPADVMAILGKSGVGYTFTQIHPTPRAPRKASRGGAGETSRARTPRKAGPGKRRPSPARRKAARKQRASSRRSPRRG